MATLLQSARNYARDHMAPDEQGDAQLGIMSWHEQCGRLMFRFGRSLAGESWQTGAVDTANIARGNSTIRTTDMDEVVVGDFVWWTIDSDDRGHVGIVVKGSGRSAKAFMASAFVAKPSWADGIGVLGVGEYTQTVPGAHFMGASKDYAGGMLPERFELLALPRVKTTEEETDVIRFKAKFFYVASMHDVRKVTLTEARALNQAFDGEPFPVVSSRAAKLIINGCRERRRKWLKDLAAVAGVSEASLDMSDMEAELDQLELDEDGFSDLDALNESSSLDPAVNSQIE